MSVHHRPETVASLKPPSAIFRKILNAVKDVLILQWFFFSEDTFSGSEIAPIYSHIISPKMGNWTDMVPHIVSIFRNFH